MRSNSRRNEILSSASNIVESLGMEKLTLEAVAKNAGISKGGLLHHFPNKEAIIKAMIEEYVNDFFSKLNERTNESIDEDGKWSRAYVEVTFNDSNTTADLSTAFVAAIFSNPQLLADYHNKNRTVIEAISNDGIDLVDATIVRLATDGLWFSENFGDGKLDEELRKQVEERLIKMTFKES